MPMLPNVLKNTRSNMNAYCPTCKAYKVVDYTNKTEGSRQEVMCLTCKSLFWIGGGYGR